MRIATYNINGVRARIETLTAWLRLRSPDVVCLQELKCSDDSFPTEALDGLGYNLLLHGQKSFNGVAILSKSPIELVRRGLPGDDQDEQARYLEAVVASNNGAVRVASIYFPNGNPIDTPKYDFKLAFMRAAGSARGIAARVAGTTDPRWRLQCHPRR